MIQITLSYKDGHSNEVAILKDKKYNVFRYINLTKGHICTCFFPDIYSAIGTPIKAVASGTVIFAEKNGPYGNLVKISHGNDVETWYAHCSAIYVSEGEEVNAGDVIAAVGATGNVTGPHLHLEIRVNGTAINPQQYLYK